jgi:hypothetical protein
MTYPITELFAWVVDDPTGEHGVIGFNMEGGLAFIQAVTSNRAVAEKVGEAAHQAARETGRPLMLQRFILAETIRTVS